MGIIFYARIEDSQHSDSLWYATRSVPTNWVGRYLNSDKVSAEDLLKEIEMLDSDGTLNSDAPLKHLNVMVGLVTE